MGTQGTGWSNESQPAVDVVISVYGEREEALTATLSACAKQDYPINKIFVVDDGSPEAVCLPPTEGPSPQISLMRLAQNQDISAARNAALSHSETPLVACINTDVVPDPDWLATCVTYLRGQPRCGACYARLVSATPKRLLTRWRMRFLETKFGHQSGPMDFAPGHAVLFRREAVSAVGGYDPYFRLHYEDADICHRMRKIGWETHFVAESRCVSIQQDHLDQLIGKVLRETAWYSPSDGSLSHLYYHHTRMTLIRAGRNIVKGRLDFLPVDAAIYVRGLWTATIRTLRYRASLRAASQSKLRT